GCEVKFLTFPFIFRLLNFLYCIFKSEPCTANIILLKWNKYKKIMIKNLNLNNSITLNNLNRDFTKPRLNAKLEPWQVTGLTDGEGGFYCSILKSEYGLTGFKVKLEFKVTQKTHSEGILYEIQEYFGCGSVVIDNRKTDTKKYHITSLSSIIEKIIPHFESYPCLTSKYLNFSDWKKIAFIMTNKEHLSPEGLKKVKYFSSKMNTSRDFEDKYNHCKNFLGLNTNGEITFELTAQWLQSFLDGEGMFYNYISENNRNGHTSPVVDSSLEIGQSSHDVAILLAIKKYFYGGYLKPKYTVNDIFECKNSLPHCGARSAEQACLTAEQRSSGAAEGSAQRSRASVNRYIFRDTKKRIQFVDQHPMLTRKYLDYLDWKKIVELINNGAHKTLEGLELMKQIKSKMNSTRGAAALKKEYIFTYLQLI
uniref:LAGLIDADG endonuclease n=1 Tax=Ramaria rubella TaxID=113071 RepID=UPI00223816D7